MKTNWPAFLTALVLLWGMASAQQPAPQATPADAPKPAEATPPAKTEAKTVDQPPEQIVVTATRVGTPMSEVAGSITVITGDEIRDRQTGTVRDAVRGAPGADVAAAGGPGQPTSMFLRGADAGHTLVLIDGVEVNDPSSVNRAFDFAHLNADNIERIEVMRGPQSVLYGSDAMGGVVNIITRKGEGKPHLWVSGEGGAYDTYREAAGCSGSASIFDWSVTGSRFQTRGFSAADRREGGNHEDDGYNNTSAAARLGVTPVDILELDFIYRYSVSQDAELDQSGGPNGDDPNYTADTEQHFLRAQADLSLWKGRWQNIVGFSYSNHDRRLHDKPDVNNPATSMKAHYEGDIFKADYQSNIRLHRSNTIVLGVENQQENFKQALSGASFWGPYTSNIPSKWAQTWSYYAQDQWSLWDGLFFGSAGARLDDHTNFGTETTWKVTPGVYVKQTDTKAWAGYATGFKAPTLFQLYSSYGKETLDPERSEAYEAGVEQGVFEKALTAGVVVFQTDYRDLVQYDFVTSKYNNVGEAHARGVEVYGLIRPHKSLTVRPSYTFTEALSDSAKVDRRLLRRPMHKAALAATWWFTEDGQVSLGVQYVGEREDIDPLMYSRTTLRDYTLLNLAASYLLLKREHADLKVFGRVDNVLDQKYQEVAGYGVARLSAYAGIEVGFQ